MINNILQWIKRSIYGSTYKFTTKKGSTSFNGASWISVFNETTKYPSKIVSITFMMENKTPGKYRIVIDGEKIFPFGDFNSIDNGVTRNFIIPIAVAANSYLQIEVRSEINNKNVIIMDEMAMIEVI